MRAKRTAGVIGAGESTEAVAGGDRRLGPGVPAGERVIGCWVSEERCEADGLLVTLWDRRMGLLRESALPMCDRRVV